MFTACIRCYGQKQGSHFVGWGDVSSSFDLITKGNESEISSWQKLGLDCSQYAMIGRLVAGLFNKEKDRFEIKAAVCRLRNPINRASLQVRC